MYVHNEVKVLKQPLTEKKFALSTLLIFLLPSLLGIFLFIVPFSYKGELTIPIAILANAVQTMLESQLPLIMTIIVVATAAFTILFKLTKPAFIKNSSFLSSLFLVSWVWTITRFVGAVYVILTYFKIGPEAVWSENTGGTLLYDLIPVLFSVFLFAGLLLPLLLNFGLLELCGALFTKFMRPIFTLPGRSSIDCLASWLGDGTIGVLLTSKQYEEGYYTKREAAVIGTTFSVVSITFTIVILSYLKLEAYIIPYYLTVLLIGLVSAIIMPRIPPLSRKPDTYHENAKDHTVADETIPKEHTSFSWGMKKALNRAENNTGVKAFFKDGIQNILDMWMGVVPVVMAIGTTALIIAEYTPVFKWIGLPFEPLLALLQVPEAAEAAQTMVVGFADMFLPAVIGSSIESELTRFVIACVSVTQLIYMSEVGGLLLGSKIPIKFLDLVIIFILRTLITLPIAVIVANILF
ncbi:MULTISPECIES: YjiH family protein [Bacillaceae]|uniref:YjiH family protein n=1 Tax=Bacillus sp. CBEL-1 TaxID=2502980 RepID=UPI001051CB6A|nr:MULTISPECIES: YjiH family protein [Bacillaceae]MDT2047223.1 YjiH family protein [Priestia flexa]TDB54979.1 YjiH family protein [Bacillus sp. CBEL-1]USY56663.1 YjiH family protein [Bacillus sp. 1780r2a1]